MCVFVVVRVNKMKAVKRKRVNYIVVVEGLRRGDRSYQVQIKDDPVSLWSRYGMEIDLTHNHSSPLYVDYYLCFLNLKFKSFSINELIGIFVL